MLCFLETTVLRFDFLPYYQVINDSKLILQIFRRKSNALDLLEF